MKKIILMNVVCLMPHFLMAAENELVVLQNQEKRTHFQEVGGDSDSDLDGKEILPLFEADFTDYFQQVKEETEKKVDGEVPPYTQLKINFNNVSMISDADLSFAFGVLFGEKSQCDGDKEEEDRFDAEDNYGFSTKDMRRWIEGMDREGEIEQQYNETKKKEEVAQHIVIVENDEEKKDQNDDKDIINNEFYPIEGKFDLENPIFINNKDSENLDKDHWQIFSKIYQNIANCSLM